MNDEAKPQLTRIQQRNREVILEAALTVFSSNGYRGATIDQIADTAGLSKPNVLYYFGSKDDIYKTLLTALLDTWLAPMLKIDRDGEPLEEVLDYVSAKLQLSRDYPRESRLFAYEILHGAPHLEEILGGRLRDLVEETVAVIAHWMRQGRLKQVEPHHLIFSIWALTQHYADFEVQVSAVLGPGHDPYAEAAVFLDNLFRQMLAP